MKARHIKKLRKTIANYKEFIVNPSVGVFGEFYLNADGSDFRCKAEDERHAIRRFLKHYERKHKERHRFWDTWFNETTKRFAQFQVIDEKGFKRYYH